MVAKLRDSFVVLRNLDQALLYPRTIGDRYVVGDTHVPGIAVATLHAHGNHRAARSCLAAQG